MKIIKDGKIPSRIKKFKCDNCGCIFEAELGEYISSSQMEVMHDDLPGWKCKCPCCGNYAYKD